MLLLVSTGCPPDGEGWDYRLAIREDMRARTTAECKGGQHLDRQCPDGSVGDHCPEVCVENERANKQ